MGAEKAPQPGVSKVRDGARDVSRHWWRRALRQPSKRPVCRSAAGPRSSTPFLPSGEPTRMGQPAQLVLAPSFLQVAAGHVPVPGYPASLLGPNLGADYGVQQGHTFKWVPLTWPSLHRALCLPGQREVQYLSHLYGLLFRLREVPEALRRLLAVSRKKSK